MTLPPLVSVYIPTRGRRKLLERAVRSALAQTYPALEVIVVVDGPDPESSEYLSAVASDARVRFLERSQSGGACAARNDALRLARGTFITGLDDDDELLPSHISRLVGALESTGRPFVATTAITRRQVGDMVRHAFEGPIPLDQLLGQNIIGNQVLTRPELLRELGGFDEEMPAWQDYDLWLRLSARFGEGYKIDARTYVQHQDHEGERISSSQRILRAQQRFVSKHAALLNPHHVASLELQALANAHAPFPVTQLLGFMKQGLTRRACTAYLGNRAPRLRKSALRVLRSARALFR